MLFQFYFPSRSKYMKSCQNSIILRKIKSEKKNSIRAHDKSTCMPLNEEIDPLKNKTGWKSRKNLNFEEYKNELIIQGKCLCGQYIRARLRRAGVLNRKVMQRLRAILEPTSNVIYEVFPALNSMCEELERMYPRLYTNVSRQLSSAPFGELLDGDQAPILLNLIAKELFKIMIMNHNNDVTTTTTTTTAITTTNIITTNSNNINLNTNKNNYTTTTANCNAISNAPTANSNSNITWGKIISLFAVCGGFAIDCVRQGHYDYLQYLIDGMSEIIEDDLIIWLTENGGWLGLQQYISIQQQKYSSKLIKNMKLSIIGWLTIFIILSSIIYFITCLFKHIGCHLYSFLF